MPRATAIVRQPAVKADRVVDTVTLDHEGRARRRMALRGENGLDVLLDLDKETLLNDGDALKLEDGRLVRVRAAPQRLLEVTAENPLRLLKAAFGLGSRHATAEITADALFCEEDPALAELVRGEGCSTRIVMRPFQPDRGAAAHDCGHDHGHHGHGHAHAHGHHHHHGDVHHGHDHHGDDHDGHGHHGHDHDGHGHHDHPEPKRGS
jgi:urease accessory protein